MQRIAEIKPPLESEDRPSGDHSIGVDSPLHRSLFASLKSRPMALMLFAAVLLVAAFVVRSAASRKDSPSVSLQTGTVQAERRDLVRTLRVHGTVEAVQAYMIAAPRLAGVPGSLIITRLVKSGSHVHKGDVLVEFDREPQLKNVLDKQAEYKDLAAQITKKQADQAAARAADETELKQAEDAEKTAELEMQKNEILSRIDAEKNQQNLSQAQATRKQLQETFQLKRQAARAELRILEIQRDRALTAMHWAEGNAKKMVIQSPMDGIAVVNSMWRQGGNSDIQEGDDVRPGLSVLQVVDPGRMQVRAKVNQADIEGLRQGQPVRIGLDAYPDLFFPGRLDGVASVATVSMFSPKTRTFAVLFSVNGADQRLLPDLSAAVDIEIDRVPNAVVVPRDTIFRRDGRSLVRVKNGSGFEDREVKPGVANDIEQAIESGVEKGAVLLRNQATP